MTILEPDKPTRADVWRRIALGHHCSLEIELNIEAPMDIKPKARFFGNLSRVKDLKEKWAISEWYVNDNIRFFFFFFFGFALKELYFTGTKMNQSMPTCYTYFKWSNPKTVI